MLSTRAAVRAGAGAARLVGVGRTGGGGPEPWSVTVLVAGAVLVGGTAGVALPVTREAASDVVDPLILTLLGLLFFTLELDRPPSVSRAARVVLLAVGVNFLLVPLIAVLVAAALVPDDAVRLGVLIYCLFPCTDWFLGFTRISGGDTRIGAVLVPVNLILQLLLCPVYLGLFTDNAVAAVPRMIGDTVFGWFLFPAAAAAAARTMMLVLPVGWRHRILAVAGRLVTATIIAIVGCMFASNIEVILHRPSSLAAVFPAAFAFFVISFLVSEAAARTFRLGHAEQALLAMTTSARNAPLLLAITAIVLPAQPLVSTAIVLGMLVEFPHLAVLTILLRRKIPLPGRT